MSCALSGVATLNQEDERTHMKTENLEVAKIGELLARHTAYAALALVMMVSLVRKEWV